MTKADGQKQPGARGFAHQERRWRVNKEERKTKCLFPLIQQHKKSLERETFPRGENPCVLSAENATLSTYCSREEK